MRRRKTLAALVATALEHQTAGLRAHAEPEAVRLGPATIVRLECALHWSLASLLDWSRKRGTIPGGQRSVKS